MTMLLPRLLGSLVLLAVVVTGCRDRQVDPDAPRVIKLGTILPDSHATVKVMKVFRERVEQLSGGRMRVHLFSSGQLGNVDEMIDGCRTGDIEVAQNSVGVLAEYIPIANALSMPFIFRDSEHQARVLDSSVGDLIRQRCELLGIELLGFLDAGTRNITTKKAPVQTPADLSGMKIRVMDARLMVDSINALGASAVAMNQGEVFTALQQGVLDGWENNPPTVATFRMYESGCIYYTWTRHLAIPDILIASKRFMSELNDQERTWVRTAAAETVAEQRRMWQEETQLALDQMAQHGMKFNDVDRELFRARVQPVYEKYYRKYGDEFRTLCEQIRSME